MIREFFCRWLGHKPRPGPWTREHFTAYTFFRDWECVRCGLSLRMEKAYTDDKPLDVWGT